MLLRYCQTLFFCSICGRCWYVFHSTETEGKCLTALFVKTAFIIWQLNLIIQCKHQVIISDTFMASAHWIIFLRTVTDTNSSIFFIIISVPKSLFIILQLFNSPTYTKIDKLPFHSSIFKHFPVKQQSTFTRKENNVNCVILQEIC